MNRKVWFCLSSLCITLLILVALDQSFASRKQKSGCPSGWEEVAREQIGDETVIYCGRPGDKQRLKDLTQGIDRAGRTPGCVGPRQCNYFVGKIGELIDIPYFRHVRTDKSSDGRMANEMYHFISKAVESKPSGWKAITPEEAQTLANRGRFVIGVAEHVTPSPTSHGHIVIVAPTPMPRTGDGSGSGPWVRDSQNPNLSVRASKRFGSSVVTPIWAVWQPGNIE